MAVLKITRTKLIIIIASLLLILAAGIRLYDMNGAGGTFDEHNYLRLAANTYQSFRDDDFSKERWIMFKEHPAIGKYIHAIFYYPLISKMSNEEQNTLIRGFYPMKDASGEIYRLGRYSSVLLGGLTILLVFLFCAAFIDIKTGAIASGILILLPNFIQYHKVATLDGPTSFFYTLGVLFFALALKKNTWNSWIVCGIMTGLAIGTKFNMMLLLIFYCIIFFVWKKGELFSSMKIITAAARQVQVKQLLRESANLLKIVWYWKLFWVPIIAFIILYLSWPWLWPAPVERMLFSISHWEPGPIIEPWFGQMTNVRTIYSYYLVYFLFTTPLLILLLFLVSLHYQWKNKTFWNVFVLLWFAAPFLWSFSFQKGDGMRYLTMIYPPLAILAAQGLLHLTKIPKRVLAGSILLMVYLATITVLIHPYYFDYYNILIGGPKNVQAKNLLEFDWFGEGKKEAVEWLNANAEANTAVGAKWNPQHDFGGWRTDITPIDLLQYSINGLPRYLMINHRYRQYDEKTDKQKIPLENYELIRTIKAGSGELGWIYKRKNIAA